MPLLLPPRKPRRLLERANLPLLLHNPLPLLLPRPLLQPRQHDVLHMPRVLVLHQAPLALPEHPCHERRHVRFVAELLDGREERLEVEDDGAAEGQPAQRLPVHAEVDARDGQVGDLQAAEVLVRVPGGHEEGFVDFETPRAALDGAVGLEVGEVSGLRLTRSVRCRVVGGVLGERYRSIENSILAL